ncbi:DNA-3-methyladenine glycosylase 2 family protein [Streptomyces sp. DSM 44917]|uniref:DNA-3-methyladenine glycosylase II n=1 Tax=Streptomyces boetiae TaxID=3075541 RepID=A0ABU2LCQ3_9ACTN|nr:DNA-3-methyladenine glycosylase 2 family protein [Streptomyces sp. DSM 44917]MDT0309362.1 DNA-3-methyladenine glycosylase 2 family protein [Streptomyces sp. DSM 44917]
MPAERSWTPSGPHARLYDLRRSLMVLRRGPYDPAFRAGRDGVIWRATRTPEGPATLRLRRPEPPRVAATAWGPGADWALERLPALLGEEDRPEEFVPHHRLLAEALRRHRGVRLIRTGLVLESLIPSVLEQRVTTQDAYRAWRLLLRRFGEPAPGPGADLGMWVMPTPEAFARVPSWEWHRAGVDGKRSAATVRAVRLARRMEEAAGMQLPEAMARLQAVPGIGPWTAAEALQRVCGAPDAVTVGDLHLPGIVGHALAGERDADDARMLELLAPYAGQRHRATRLLLLTGVSPPRRAPRQRHADIARI